MLWHVCNACCHYAVYCHSISERWHTPQQYPLAEVPQKTLSKEQQPESPIVCSMEAFPGAIEMASWGNLGGQRPYKVSMNGNTSLISPFSFPTVVSGTYLSRLHACSSLLFVTSRYITNCLFGIQTSGKATRVSGIQSIEVWPVHPGIFFFVVLFVLTFLFFAQNTIRQHYCTIFALSHRSLLLRFLPFDWWSSHLCNAACSTLGFLNVVWEAGAWDNLEVNPDSSYQIKNQCCTGKN